MKKQILAEQQLMILHQQKQVTNISNFNHHTNNLMKLEYPVFINSFFNLISLLYYNKYLQYYVPKFMSIYLGTNLCLLYRNILSIKVCLLLFHIGDPNGLQYSTNRNDTGWLPEESSTSFEQMYESIMSAWKSLPTNMVIKISR